MPRDTTIEGASRDFRAYVDRFDSRLPEVLAGSVARMRRRARDLVPVRTGALQSTILAYLTQRELVLEAGGLGVDYAELVESEARFLELAAAGEVDPVGDAVAADVARGVLGG